MSPYILIGITVALITLIKPSRRGVPAARIGVMVLSLLLLGAALYRMIGMPDANSRTVASFIDFNQISGEYVGRFVADAYPGARVVTRAPAIEIGSQKTGAVNEAIVKGLRTAFSDNNQSFALVVRPMSDTLIFPNGAGPAGLVDDPADVPTELPPADVIISLAGTPDPRWIPTVNGQNGNGHGKAPVLIVLQHPYPPLLVSALRNGSVAGLILLRPGVDPAIIANPNASLEEEFNRRFIWVTAANADILYTL